MVGVLVHFEAKPAAGEAMRATASELFTAAPAVDHVDIVAAKPGSPTGPTGPTEPTRPSA
ncbi:MAG TPA: hypothetical protein VK611_01650 [Acidimicrobiales bacterium]|nr:hypothetical protein [Acidimicrobiales bacterium]